MSNLVFQLAVDRGKNMSLLKQIGVKADFGLLVNAPTMEAGPDNPLVTLMFGLRQNRFAQLEPAASLLPHFLSPNPNPNSPPSIILVPIKKWLETKIIVVGEKRFSRSDVIIMLRNQDGGAHSDVETDSDLELLTDSFLVSKASNVVIEGKSFSPWENLPAIPLVGMRQIAFELISAIYSQSDFEAVAGLTTIVAVFDEKKFVVRKPSRYPSPPSVWGQEPAEVAPAQGDLPAVRYSFTHQSPFLKQQSGKSAGDLGPK